MVDPESGVANRVGPFAAGSTSSDLIGLANQGDPGLRVLEHEEQQRDYYKARCDALASTAREFFFDFDRTSSLIFQKTRDTTGLPDFVEYVYCWLADDRHCGFILSGVTSDAGTHEQINQQESAFWEHTAEVAEALSRKYPESPESFVNFFNFGTYSELPQLPASVPAILFTGYRGWGSPPRTTSQPPESRPTTVAPRWYTPRARIMTPTSPPPRPIPASPRGDSSPIRTSWSSTTSRSNAPSGPSSPSMSSKTWSISPASWPTTLAGN